VTIPLTLAPRRAAVSARQAITRSPATVVLALTLLATTILLRHGVLPGDFLQDVSTNVTNLTQVPLRVFIASALVLDGGHWIIYAVALALTLGWLERRIGSLRAVGIFASGHVLATILTEGAVWVGINAGTLPDADRDQIDVGVSYGLWTAIAAAAVLLPRRWRLVLIPVALVGVVLPAVTVHDMTSIGHLLSLSIGLAWWPYIQRRAHN
jgi:hypothetical protein